MIKYALLFVAALCLTVAQGRSEVYGYLPGSPLGIGAGFDRLTPTVAKPPCLTIAGKAESKPPEGSRFNIGISLVRNRKDLYDTMHIDVNLMASGFGSQANANTSVDQETSYIEEDLTWILSLTERYGSRELDPVLNDTASKLVKTPSLFYDRCGTEYVQIETRQSDLYVMFSMHNLDSSSKKSLADSFSGSGSIAGVSVSLNANFRSFLADAIAKSTVDIRILGAGGAGIKNLGSIVLDASNFPAPNTTGS